MNIVLSIVGLALLLIGANYLTDGSVALAKRLRISEMIIGLTIVAIGTSMPELTVSVMSSITGQYDIAVGNVIGSNIFNLFAILGITVLIRPITLTKGNIRRDIPIGVLVSVMLWAACSGTILEGAEFNVVTRGSGIILLSMFFAFIYLMILSSREDVQPEDDSSTKKSPLWLALIMIVGGVAALIFGGKLFLQAVTEMARQMNISESVISITVVAIGTSLPELATSVVAIIKRNPAIALGNVVGSNIINILLVAGLSATIHPLTLTGITQVDLLTMVLSSVLLFLSVYTFGRKKIDRIEGAFFLLVYIGYMVWLVR